MPRYFFDLKDEKASYVDTIGSDIADRDAIPGEAISFLASVFRDAALQHGDAVLLVSVRNEADAVIFTATLTLHSDWPEAGGRAATTTAERRIVPIVEHEFLTRTVGAEMISGAGSTSSRRRASFGNASA